MKRAYTIWICPKCEEHYLYGGSCDGDGERLIATRVIPVTTIESFKDSMVASSSPVPAWFIENFVGELLKSCSALRLRG